MESTQGPAVGQVLVDADEEDDEDEDDTDAWLKGLLRKGAPIRCQIDRIGTRWFSDDPKRTFAEVIDDWDARP